MKAAEFFRRLSDNRADRRELIMQIGFVFCLLIVNVVLLSYIINQEVLLSSETEKLKQIAWMSANRESEIVSYDAHRESDSSSVLKNKIDLIQGSLVSYLEQSRDIKVKSMSVKVNDETGEKDKPQDICGFELLLSGSWGNLMQACSDLDNRAFVGQKALIDITSIHLQNSDDNAKSDLVADITYDIYAD